MADRNPVVVGVDSAAHQLAAVGWGATEAVSRGAELRLVRNAPPELASAALSTNPHSDRHIARAARHLLANAQAYALAVAPSVRVSTVLPEGSAIRHLEAAIGTPSLVVVGQPDRDRLGGSQFASTGLALMGCTTCPAVVVRTKADWRRPSDAPVVIGLDDDFPPGVTEDVLEFGFQSALRTKAPLVAVEAGENHETTARLRACWRQYPDIRVCRHIVGDHTSRALIDWTRSARLLVLGCHREDDLGLLTPGAATRTSVDFARCPTVLVRSRTKNGALQKDMR
ncbi:universal stress protein [Fodinicola feengrottensis]|uniref:universal stress protein n=1 Tax=Fodinicola feengrottensis TaxID=435914 RepID=UPI0013CF6111|nr:universal stress protein [Fodinicola feengrottensis]